MRVFIISEKHELYYWGEELKADMKRTEELMIIQKINSDDIKENPLFTSVAAGPNHCVLLSSNHDLFAWGENRHSRLGFPRKGRNAPAQDCEISPTLVVSLKSILESRVKTKQRVGGRADRGAAAPLAR